ncbi:hypothetical protein BsWGS_23318 [Bradybaena similaris]
MDAAEFRARGREMVDYIANYLETIHLRQPLPNVSPGYLKDLVPGEAPVTGESWEDVKKDLDRVIMPGVTHWHSPHFHAYFPTANSYPAILGDMLSDGIGCVGFTWAASPVCTELEVTVMDWLAKLLRLPKEFIFSEEGKGGGVIQSHSSVERAGLIALVKMRKLPTDENGSLRGPTLENAIREDKENGLIPFFVCATVGSTPSCAFDNLEELGPVCSSHDVWLHVDAAYAGSACICPEFQYLLAGVEHCTTFNFNPHKWLKVNFDCSALWVKDKDLISGAFEIDPLYLKYHNQGQLMPDYRHWQIPLGRRFRSLKLWFVLRMFGVDGLQQQIRKDVCLAKIFEALVGSDARFEIVRKVTLGLVCFRLKGENSITESLHKKINDDRRIHLVPSMVKDIYFLRFAICGSGTQKDDVTFAWSVIQELTNSMLLH